LQDTGSSRRFVWLGLAVAAVVLLWVVGWFALSQYMTRAIDRWAVDQAAQGRAWSCEDRRIGGFPFRLIVRCQTLRLTDEGRDMRLVLGEFRAMTQIYNHRLIIAEADGPLTVDLGGMDDRAHAQWSHLRLSLRRAAHGPERVSARVEGLRASVPFAAHAREEVSAAAAEFHFRPAPDTAPAAGGVDIALIVEELEGAMLDRLTGEPGPGHAELVARITHTPVLLAGGRTQRARLEAWRKSGGQVTLQKSSARQGRIHIEATGALGLDDQRRPAGAIDARAAGLERLMARARGGDNDAGRDRGMIGRLSGLAARAAEPQARADDARKAYAPLPLRLRNGAVWLGPLPLVRFGPLY